MMRHAEAEAQEPFEAQSAPKLPMHKNVLTQRDCESKTIMKTMFDTNMMQERLRRRWALLEEGRTTDDVCEYNLGDRRPKPSWLH